MQIYHTMRFINIAFYFHLIQKSIKYMHHYIFRYIITTKLIAPVSFILKLVEFYKSKHNVIQLLFGHPMYICIYMTFTNIFETKLLVKAKTCTRLSWKRMHIFYFVQHVYYKVLKTIYSFMIIIWSYFLLSYYNFQINYCISSCILPSAYHPV